MVRTLEWARRESPQLLARWREVPRVYLAAEPAAMLNVLAELRERCGSVRQYVLSIGVDEAVLARLADEVLEPDPG
jgi:hypothetical protein